MIKLINIITQIIIVLGCCAILIFTLSIAIAFAKNDFATILYQQIKYSSLNHIKINIMKTRKHFIRKYELLARCIQTNLELFILQQ